VIKWQKRLNDTCDPESAQHTGNKKEHFPFSDFGAGEMAFCEYYADDKEDGKSHQLVNLKAGNVIDELNFFQHYPDGLQIFP
jgi:hypothetical protein